MFYLAALLTNFPLLSLSSQGSRVDVDFDLSLPFDIVGELNVQSVEKCLRLIQISYSLGVDMKSCILRAVCDCKRFLLPPGYSMIQDILRVVFTYVFKYF